MQPTDEVKFTVEELRKMAAECSTFKNLLEKYKPEVLAQKIDIEQGLIWSEATNIPYMMISQGGRFIAVNLANAWSSQPRDANGFNYIKKFMKDGTITITVENSKIAGATVKED